MIAHLLFIAITFNSLHINKAKSEPTQPSHMRALRDTMGGSVPMVKARCPDPASELIVRPGALWKVPKTNRAMWGSGQTSPTDSLLFLLAGRERLWENLCLLPSCSVP